MSDEKGPDGGRSFAELKQEIANDILAMERPSDLVMITLYGISLYSALHVCASAGIFQRLVQTTSPVSVVELARKLGGDEARDGALETQRREEFLTRQLRAVCALKFADEVGPGSYRANAITHTLAHPGFESGVQHMHRNMLGPSSLMASMSEWAVDNHYQAPETATDGPFQRAFGAVGQPTFPYWVQHHPDSITWLNAWMQRIQHDRLNWSEWFPADVLFGSDDKAGGDGDEGVFMVDVGGGRGHDLHGLASRYPDRKMRLVLQDMPQVIAEARTQGLDPRIELMQHDFFATQPVKGAQIYFMHKIMHDWPDAECAQILAQLRDAMAPDSRLFLNDAILPDQGTPLLYAAFDLTMLGLLGAKERSESMWTRLIDAVGGLAVRKFWQAPGMRGEGIVEVVKAP